MAAEISPFVEANFGWPYGSSGWNDDMDANLVKFSYLFDRNIDGIVGSLPAIVNGKAYFLTLDNRLYFDVDGQRYSSPTPKWFVVTDRVSGQTYQFDGTTLNNIDTPSSIDSRLDSVELVLTSTGSSLVGHTDGLTGSIDTDVSATLKEIINARRFGAIGNGVTDDTAAIQSALIAAAGKILIIPAGNYIISSTLYTPASTTVVGQGKFDNWDTQTGGTRFSTTGGGNAQRWTDITGSDAADDTPLFVAMGASVYYENITLNTNSWSIGFMFPCVKQCGVLRCQGFGFTDACLYLDLTWSDRNTTLKALHPTINPSTGMNEFFAEDYWFIGGGSAGGGIKIQGTTRSGTSVATSADWLWGWGGASDTVFSKGRLSATGSTGFCFSHDAQLFGANVFAQGTTVRDNALRLSSSGRYAAKLDRSNRIVFDGCYGETTGTNGIVFNVTTNTQNSVDGVLRVNDKINADVYLNDVDTGFSGSTVPWSVTRCITMKRVDGRDYTANFDSSRNSSQSLKIKSFSTLGQTIFSFDNGTTVTDFFRVRNDRLQPEVNLSMDVGAASFNFNKSFIAQRFFTAAVFDSAGSGTPEGVVTAPIGSTYRRTNGGAVTTLYVKESGTGNTGWVAK
jgi:hypothetical protein